MIKIFNFKKLLFVVSCLLLSIMGINAQDNVYVYKDGIVVFKEKANAIDSVALDENKAELTFYTPEGTALYNSAISNIDSITFAPVKPVADVLDIIFNADGTVEDISPMRNTVEIISTNSTVETYYNEVYGRYVAKFENNWGTGNLGDNPNYCKIDYSTNEAFKNALADGHTLETLFLASYDKPILNAEAKWFASHEAGGTGLMICNTNADGRGNEITFLPNVSENGNSSWKWANSGVVPEPDIFYHVVGVWNKEEEKAYVYVNGELKKTVDAKGDFIFAPNITAQWFGIGCDAGPAVGQFGGKFEIVTARIYDAPLLQQDVEALWEEIEQQQEKPVADLLDIRFKTDGTAEDISPMKNKVTTVESGALSTYYNTNFECFVARFGNTWAGTTSGYYKIDYENNSAFKEALADGHSLETVVMANYTPPIPNGEAKWFSSHEAGGTGLMICNTNANGRGNEFTFLPNVSQSSSSNWIWATSGVVPEQRVYYHVVGVWNKEEGKAYIYVNGELKNTVDAVGDLRFPIAGCNWFGIGGDAGPSGAAQLGWNGDVVLARVYGDPLTKENVAVLWEDVKRKQAKVDSDMVTEVEYYSGIAVTVDGTYQIRGKGFQEGDKISFTSIADETTLVLDGVLAEDKSSLEVTIPEGIKTEQYRMLLVRGEKIQDLGLTTINVVDVFPDGAHVIAHRGYWDTEGSAQNSLAAIRKAQELEIYGTEIDIWLTTDGYLMLNHDESYQGVSIQNSTYDQVKDLTLSNGEKMPQLKDCLDLIKEKNTTKLIIEFKTHATAEKNKAVVKAAIEAVESANIKDLVEYIAFDLDICKEVVRLEPTAKIAYLTGGTAPKQLHNLGITGIDYHLQEFTDNPQWVKEAKDLGMTVNVWTVNTIGDMARMTNLGVDFITTDKPLDALKIREYYLSKSVNE